MNPNKEISNCPEADDSNIWGEAKSFDQYKKERLDAEFKSQLKDSEEIRNEFSKISTGNGTGFLNGAVYAEVGEDGFSGDGASLFCW